MIPSYIAIKENLTQRRKGAKKAASLPGPRIYFAPLRLCVR
jgi:hypothetical protein